MKYNIVNNHTITSSIQDSRVKSQDIHIRYSTLL